jgi:hypothetical protein
MSVHDKKIELVEIVHHIAFTKSLTGIAIPIDWVLLHKKGNSNTRERIALMKRFIKQFGSENIIRVLVDREFIGCDWLTWLQSQDIDFGIRIKKDAKIPNAQGE